MNNTTLWATQCKGNCTTVYMCKRSSGWIRYDIHTHVTEPSAKYMYLIVTSQLGTYILRLVALYEYDYCTTVSQKMAAVTPLPVTSLNADSFSKCFKWLVSTTMWNNVTDDAADQWCTCLHAYNLVRGHFEYYRCFWWLTTITNHFNYFINFPGSTIPPSVWCCKAVCQRQEFPVAISAPPTLQMTVTNAEF